MFNRPGTRVDTQLTRLSERLLEENPALEGVVEQFREVDRIGYRAGLLDSEEESYAFTISWWPMIAVLGTFSAGKSTFINEFVGLEVQRSGSQAVDDRFTVLSYGAGDEVKELPGLALDGDPRFPFYRVSHEIDRLSDGAGRTVDHFLAMKTVPSKRLQGRILIDSPGFDADEQRATILQLTDHIIDLSDLVLVFFDARHPEPGAMRDTLEHLVNRVAGRSDFTKLVFILNMVDTTWREDNLEEVVSAWQRAVVREGNTTGRFYRIYNESAAVDIPDEKLRARYDRKVSRDREEIHAKIAEISSSRSYRIVGTLQAIAESIEMDTLPALRDAMARWRRNVLWSDAVLMTIVLAAVIWGVSALGGGFGAWFDGSIIEAVQQRPIAWAVSSAALLGVLLGIHFMNRHWNAQRIARGLRDESASGNWRTAFLKNTVFWRSLLRTTPSGLGKNHLRKLHLLRDRAEGFVQRLNNAFMGAGKPTEPDGTDAVDATPGAEKDADSSRSAVANENGS
ncbi:dynamin family protein [Wenzhouxiangella limi]|uniref:Dynamin family protein n=1 Tax=Wenzhouxiangella limi TaxID=2707351 RepID=A0A845UYC9_9GAMM|nr:dynamin family protein [Wenzhouxiangella limi]NDY94880.1 dynamin family protein [Wenzhouxiangella limi]